MENNIESICLDLYGLPGSGKSTISHMLAEKLHGEINVCEPSYNIDHQKSVICRIYNKSFEVVSLLLLHPCVFISIVTIIRRCGYTPLNHVFYIHLLNICYKIGILITPPKGYIIFDQGLWQSVMSLYYQKKDKSTMVDVYRQLYKLTSKNLYTINIYISVDIETAIKRMDSRHTNISRVQKLNAEERTEELKEQLLMIEKIFNTSLAVDSGRKSINECVGIITEELASRKK